MCVEILRNVHRKFLRHKLETCATKDGTIAALIKHFDPLKIARNLALLISD